MKFKHGVRSYYSVAQVRAYMERINAPSAWLNDLSSFRPTLANLERLVRLHLLAFPFENSPLHYTAAHEMDVNTDSVYSRLVENGQGGTWCCGQNGLFLGALRGLGYRGYATAGRVNMSPATSKEATEFTFLSHLVLIVQLASETSSENDGTVPPDSSPGVAQETTFLVDVGFGGNGLVRPIRLEVGQTVLGSAPPEEHRLVRGMHPESSLEVDESNLDWVLQYRCGAHQPDWIVLYIFNARESFPEDWVAFSQWLSQHPVEPFLSNVVCVRHFVVEDKISSNEGDEKMAAPLGRLVMMHRRVQKRIGDQSQTVKEFSTERERIQILKDDFGVTVDEGDIQNISHTAAALPVP